MSEILPKKSKSRPELLGELAAREGGEITYLDRLAVAVPNSLDWLRILDENGRVLRTHYRGLLDEDLIRIVLYGAQAKDLFQVDSRWLVERMQDDLDEGNKQDYKKAEALYERATAALYVLNNFTHEEIQGEFNLRRRNDFLNGGSEMNFEKTINTLAFACSKDLGETFKNIGYSPI